MSKKLNTLPFDIITKICEHVNFEDLLCLRNTSLALLKVINYNTSCIKVFTSTAELKLNLSKKITQWFSSKIKIYSNIKPLPTYSLLILVKNDEALKNSEKLLFQENSQEYIQESIQEIKNDSFLIRVDCCLLTRYCYCFGVKSKYERRFSDIDTLKTLNLRTKNTMGMNLEDISLKNFSCEVYNCKTDKCSLSKVKGYSGVDEIINFLDKGCKLSSICDGDLGLSDENLSVMENEEIFLTSPHWQLLQKINDVIIFQGVERGMQCFKVFVNKDIDEISKVWKYIEKINQRWEELYYK
ncbi:hypothetical protein HDU92_007649 [Lobulomyces angularis]|nr:hypothetical protein HDU92_007649 [Lobulomyces angularis]